MPEISAKGYQVEIDLDDAGTTPNLVAICPISVDESLNPVVDTFFKLCLNGESSSKTVGIDREFSLDFKYDTDNTAHAYIKAKKDTGLESTNGWSVTSCKITDETGTTLTFPAEITDITRTISFDEAITYSMTIKPRGAVVVA